MKLERTTFSLGISLINKEYRELNPLSCGMHACHAGHCAYGMRTYYMIHYVNEGKGTVYTDEKNFTVTKGMMFLIRPYEPVRYVADENEPWNYTFILFNGELAEKLDNVERVKYISAEPFEIIEKIYNRKDTKEEMATAALYMIFAELLSGAPQRPLHVERALNIINVSFHKNTLSVENIASDIGIDRRYLARIFKANIGMTVQEYIIKTRMENAKKILTNGITVSETASLVGYSDSFNFSKTFKKHVGISPKQYAMAKISGNG